MFLPFPSRCEYIADRRICFPTEYLVRFLGCSPNLLYISFTTTHDGIRDLHAGSRLKLIDKREYGKSGTGTEVEDLHLLTVFRMQHAVDRFDVRLSKIYDVYIIADARPVRGVIVITEHFQLRTQSGSGLRDERKEVLRYTVRQYSDNSGRMGSDSN